MKMRLPNTLHRLFGWGFLAACVCLAVVAGISGVAGGVWWMIPLFLMVGFLVGGSVLYLYPRLVLRPDGVSVRWMLRTRSYQWQDFVQAGILRIVGRGMCTNMIVLLPAGGSRRGHRDFWFRLRNWGRLIYVPCDHRTRQYVISHYGPLDFSLFDSRWERPAAK